jgi:hypothetical protein
MVKQSKVSATTCHHQTFPLMLIEKKNRTKIVIEKKKKNRTIDRTICSSCARLILLRPFDQ